MTFHGTDYATVPSSTLILFFCDREKQLRTVLILMKICFGLRSFTNCKNPQHFKSNRGEGLVLCGNGANAAGQSTVWETQCHTTLSCPFLFLVA